MATEKWTLDDFKKWRDTGQQPYEAKAKPKRSKYGAVPTYTDGIRFDSKGEAEYFKRLQFEKQGGLIKWFCRQPRFDLPGLIEYRPDFIVCDNDGTVRVVDFKGHETPEYKLKKKLMLSEHGIEVEEAK